MNRDHSVIFEIAFKYCIKVFSVLTSSSLVYVSGRKKSGFNTKRGIKEFEMHFTFGKY